MSTKRAPSSKPAAVPGTKGRKAQTKAANRNSSVQTKDNVAADGPLTAADHLVASLRADATSAQVSSLVSLLSAAHCRPLSIEAEESLREADAEAFASAKKLASSDATEATASGSSSSVAAASGPSVVPAAPVAAALDADEEDDDDEKKANGASSDDPLGKFAPDSAESLLAKYGSDPRRPPCEFLASEVTILDLSATPVPKEVQSITAFGLTWQPVGPRVNPPTATSASSSASSGSSSSSFSLHALAESLDISNAARSSSNGDGSFVLPSGLPLVTPRPLSSSASPSSSGLGDVDGGRVTFLSLESALFASPPAESLSPFRRRLEEELPRALRANEEAMEVAEAQGELEDVGALYLERQKLLKELQALQRDVPPNADLVEVRDSITLPLGFVPLDGKIYFIQRKDLAGQSPISDEHVGVAQIHPGGAFKPEPFAADDGDDSEEDDGSVALARESMILTPKDNLALRRLFGDARPHMTLLWSGRTHGFTGQEFHARCDGKGPTLTVIRARRDDDEVDDDAAQTQTATRAFGAYTDESWRSHGQTFGGNNMFFFSLGSGAQPRVSKVVPQHISSTLSDFPTLGPSFCGSLLKVHSNELQVDNKAVAGRGTSDVCHLPAVAGFDPLPNGMVAGKQSFVVQDIEVFAVTRSGLPYPSSSSASFSSDAKSARLEKKKNAAAAAAAAGAVSKASYSSSAPFGQPPAAKRKRGARGGRYAQDEEDEDDNSE